MPRRVGITYKRADESTVDSSIRTAAESKANEHRAIQTEISERNMLLSSIPLCGLLLIINLEPSSTHPIRPGWTDTDMDVLKVLLQTLEESVSDRIPEEDGGVDSADTEDVSSEPQPGLDEAQIREFLSAKNLKSVRNDSTKKSSGCFGRRMDRIGSMSSLGCNTIGRYNPK